MAVRVVIAEDEAIIRLDLKEILEEEGYEVVGETGRGDEVLQKVTDSKPDVVILDIKMPGKDGLAVAKDITEQRLAAVLILTAFSQRALVDEAVSAGALQYLVKPFQKAELVPAIEVALGRFRQIRDLESDNRTLEDQLETRKMVDRAKDMLMDRHHMAANDAFSFIQRTAMRERLTMRVTAQRMLDGELEPPATGETPAV
ncbi:MAG: response regulator [Actinobacteria bacterium]|jgi:response regulator NasT|nr:response regulator [Actinomycetota bacterium]